jgi:hypothetical protein
MSGPYLYADLIAQAMFGRGKMRSKQIYLRVLRKAKQERWHLTTHWRATVRNSLQRYSKQSRKFCGTYRFIHHDRGVWECRK